MLEELYTLQMYDTVATIILHSTSKYHGLHRWETLVVERN